MAKNKNDKKNRAVKKVVPGTLGTNNTGKLKPDMGMPGPEKKEENTKSKTKGR